MIVVEALAGPAVAEQQVEVVERKGRGHPDSICDAVMDAVSVALCTAYRRQCGTVLHHNIDKGLLVAGRVELEFGGGRVSEPMELIIGDRAADRCADRRIDVPGIATATARDWFRRHLPRIDVEHHLRVRPVLAPGSAELADIFARRGRLHVANDTSAAVGYAPLSPTEKAVLALENHLNSAAFKERCPETGEDVKIMGLRRGRQLDLTVAMPLLADQVGSEADYFARKQAVINEMEAFLVRCGDFSGRRVHFNTLDLPGRGLAGTYLSLLGTSAEGGDSGQVGRGNRVNGLIALNRPLGTEAAAGKNPVSHVGKIYNLLAHQAAGRIHRQVEGIREVYVWLVSRIGRPIDQPAMAHVELVPEPAADLAALRPRVRRVVEEELSGIGELCERLSRGEFKIC